MTAKTKDQETTQTKETKTSKTITKPKAAKSSSKSTKKTATTRAKKAATPKTNKAGKTASAKSRSKVEAKAVDAKAAHKTEAKTAKTELNAPAKPKTESKTKAKTETKAASTSKPKKSKASKAKSSHLLTEKQLLAMPEDDYMNDEQLAFFKQRLIDLEQDILKNANATTDNLRDTKYAPDPADRATIEEEYALELRTRDRERKLLKKVQQSLHLIDSKEYGWCEETGEPIGIPRLLARPTATLSLEAQERREKRQKQFGD